MEDPSSKAVVRFLVFPADAAALYLLLFRWSCGLFHEPLGARRYSQAPSAVLPRRVGPSQRRGVWRLVDS